MLILVPHGVVWISFALLLPFCRSLVTYVHVVAFVGHWAIQSIRSFGTFPLVWCLSEHFGLLVCDSVLECALRTRNQTKRSAA